MSLHASDLDKMTCSNPDCHVQHGPLYLHSRCHPTDPTYSKYVEGTLIVECATCKAVVTTIAVAP